MAKLARLPSFDRNAAEATESRVPRLRTRYYAFLSYSHRDKELADWLHRELEKFRVPHTIVGKLTADKNAALRDLLAKEVVAEGVVGEEGAGKTLDVTSVKSAAAQR